MLVLQQYCTTLDSTVQHKILQVNMFVSIYYYFLSFTAQYSIESHGYINLCTTWNVQEYIWNTLMNVSVKKYKDTHELIEECIS